MYKINKLLHEIVWQDWQAICHSYHCFDMSDSEFQKVTYKRKNSKLRINKRLGNNVSPLSDTQFDLDTAIRRITDAKIEISSTDLYASVVASLKEGLSCLENPVISDIICLGLGKIGECLTARYQFVVILSLCEIFNTNIFAYDPAFTENDKKILSSFKVTILTDNLEGKYRVKNKETILFYMPHCSKQLTNNLLWANWGLHLNHCIIIANSFRKIIESNSSKNLQIQAGYVSKILPYVLELAIINSFKYYDIFNDIAIHVFPQLNLVCPDLWRDSLEPKYTEVDVEFITDSK